MGKIALAAIAVIVAIGAVYFVDVDVTQEAKLPDVDVTVEGGQLPEAEVKTGDVEVGTTEITVPTVELQTPEEDARDRDDG